MAKLSDNYYLRKHYLKTNQVPTQTMMKAKMSPLLANVYFNEMTSKIKVRAGLEPLLMGGGLEWYVPPKKLLEGRMVLSPEKKACLAKCNYIGVDNVGMQLHEKELKLRQDETKYQLFLNDKKWHQRVDELTPLLHDQYSQISENKIKANIANALGQFEKIYRTSITKFESLMSGVVAQAVQAQQVHIHKQMSNKYEYSLKQQSLQIRDTFKKRLKEENNKLKTKFIADAEVSRAEAAEDIHDVKLEKQLILGALRRYNEYLKLACQVYVALKEQEECNQKMELSKNKYKHKLKDSKEKIALQGLELQNWKQKISERHKFDMIWTEKVKRLVKYFQLFITYCLQELPEQAEFFMDLEKLTLLQLNEVLDDAKADSLFVSEDEVVEDHVYPTPLPTPYYLLCDKERNKSPLDLNLCPKKVSSPTEFPVIVINKRCIYSACDNFKQLSGKLTQFIHGKYEAELHLEDHYNYEHAVPVKYTASQQLSELKLESSLQQILQEELSNKQLTQCPICNMPNCLCGILPRSDSSPKLSSPPLAVQIDTKLPYNKVPHRTELEHEREPKLESYSKFVQSSTCGCSKTIRKDLMEHLPPYMRQISVYEAPELPNYKMCSIQTLRNLVKKSRNITEQCPLEPPLHITSDAETQYEDVEFEKLCKCFSLEQDNVAMNNEFDISHRNIITSLLGFDLSSFTAF